MSAKESQRLFLGVPLTEEVRAGVRAHLDRCLVKGRVPGRPVPDQNWHLTVRFLGQAPPWARARAVSELESADLGQAFDLRLEHAGAFPGLERARVLWIGAAEGAEAFTELAHTAERAVRRAGFDAERRPAVAHLTLARLKRPEDLTGTVESLGSAGLTLRVDRLVLFCSHLGRGPARYEELVSFPLGE